MRKILPFISNYGLVLILLVFMGLALGFYYQPELFLTYPASLDTDKIIALTNEPRVKAGLAPVTRSPILEKAARLKAKDIFQRKYFSHVNPLGQDIRHWLKAAGYKFETAGENLSLDFYSEEGVIKNWMSSQSHRDNILTEHYLDIGVAALGGRLMGSDRVVVVQFFGQPGKK